MPDLRSDGIHSILNFIQLTPRIGTAGQPTLQQFSDIVDEGYQVVLNLALHDSDNAIAEEGSLVASLGMTYIHMPIDFENPTAQHAKQFNRLMSALDTSRVFVHCAMNLRVSAFMLLYLKYVEGLTQEAATSPLIEKWTPRMTPVWKEFLALPKDAVVDQV